MRQRANAAFPLSPMGTTTTHLPLALPPLHAPPPTPCRAFLMPRTPATFAARRNVFFAADLSSHISFISFPFLSFPRPSLRSSAFRCYLFYLFDYSLSFCYSIMNIATRFAARVKNIEHDSPALRLARSSAGKARGEWRGTTGWVGCWLKGASIEFRDFEFRRIPIASNIFYETRIFLVFEMLSLCYADSCCVIFELTNRWID